MASSTSSETFYFFDYETLGRSAIWDRPAQFAGLRTDHDLNIIDEPCMLYCRPSDDYLPDPGACRVTGITPDLLLDKGVAECDFIARVREQIGAPGTCSLGYNTIRFDDEFTRQTSFRNFHDAYTQEYLDGCSRWDLIDVVRLCRALRPDGIAWPVDDDGQPDNRLGQLTELNGIAHENAHDALADVHATIALAKLLRTRQPRLFDFALNHRDKLSAATLLDLSRQAAVLWASGSIPRDRHQLAPVMPLQPHPGNRNTMLVADLGIDPQHWLNTSPDNWRLPLLPGEDAAALPTDTTILPVYTVRTNACPVLAPLATLRPEDGNRLDLDKAAIERHRQTLIDRWTPDAQSALDRLYEARRFPPPLDVDDSLYGGGFFSHHDKRLFAAIRDAEANALSAFHGQFDDPRGNVMLFRYRARNYPDSLSPAEREQWAQHVNDRLDANSDKVPWQTFSSYQRALDDADWHTTERALEASLRRYGESLRQRYPHAG